MAASSMGVALSGAGLPAKKEALVKPLLHHTPVDLATPQFSAGGCEKDGAAATTSTAHTPAKTKGQQEGATPKRKMGDKGDRGDRIACPYDPRHSIYESQLHHHRANCPLYKENQAIHEQVYYTKNINLPYTNTMHHAEAVLAEEGVESVAAVAADDDHDAEEEPVLKTYLADLQQVLYCFTSHLYRFTTWCVCVCVCMCVCVYVCVEGVT